MSDQFRRLLASVPPEVLLHNSNSCKSSGDVDLSSLPQSARIPNNPAEACNDVSVVGNVLADREFNSLANRAHDALLLGDREINDALQKCNLLKNTGAPYVKSNGRATYLSNGEHCEAIYEGIDSAGGLGNFGVEGSRRGGGGYGRGGDGIQIQRRYDPNRIRIQPLDQDTIQIQPNDSGRGFLK